MKTALQQINTMSAYDKDIDYKLVRHLIRKAEIPGTEDWLFEIYRLAIIGEAAEKALSQAACLEIFEPEYAEIHNADQLVEWAKKE